MKMSPFHIFLDTHLILHTLVSYVARTHPTCAVPVVDPPKMNQFWRIQHIANDIFEESEQQLGDSSSNKSYICLFNNITL